VVARNLGDCAIQSGFLLKLAQRGYANQYLVWTRPQTAFLFQEIADCEVVTSQFPVGTNKQFGWRSWGGFVRAVRTIRRYRPSVTLDLIGDVRERQFARLTGAGTRLHIGWSRGHPFTRMIRNPLGTGHPAVVIPNDIVNVYAAYDRMLDFLAPPVEGAIGTGEEPGHSGVSSATAVRKIGLHPFASQQCKLWPQENWRALVEALVEARAQITAYGAPNERSALEQLLGPLTQHVSLVTGSITGFAESVRLLDVMVGLDSFSVHLAQRLGVRSVTINAGNPPHLWAPPDGRALGSSGSCPFYPCYNVPRCESGPRPYACVRSIAVRDVLDAINNEPVPRAPAYV